MTDSEIIEYAKEELGYPDVDVYTSDASIQKFINRGLDMLTSYVFRQITFVAPCKDSQMLDREKIRFIIDVTPYQFTDGSQAAVYYRDDFTLAEAVQYFNIYSNNSVLIPVVATMTYNQINYAFNRTFDWHYNDQTGELTTTHIPVGTKVLAITAKTYYERENLDKEYETWLLKYTIAKLKQREGRIESKYKEGSVGAPSDGADLKTEGQTLEDACLAELPNFVSLDVGKRV